MSRTFDCDKGFISKLLQTKDLTEVQDAQIDISYLSGDSKLAYKFITEMFTKTGEVPTVRAFTKKFPQYDLETVVNEDDEEVVGTEENMQYWCSELRAKKKHNSLADATEDILQSLEDYKADEAFDRMKKAVAYIENEVEPTEDVDITDTAGRKERYLKRKEAKGMLGIPTGIEHLDYILRGLQDETLSTVIANTGVGKTWLEVMIGSYAMTQGYNVLQFVTEMPIEQMRDRYEAMLYSMLHGSFNYSHFMRGTLSTKQEKKYFKFLDKELPKMQSLEVINATSMMGVSASYDKYGADLILIDGVYLMDDDQKADSDWLRVAHITRDAKKLAKRIKKPILVNSQADKNTSKKTGPELGNISYSQAIGMDSDNVIAMFRDQTMIADQEMCIKVIKQREGECGRVMMTWDFEHMKFSGIYSEKESGDSYSDEDSEEVGNNTLEEID